MRNYEAVRQWAAAISAEKAHEEITKLRLKYPWLKCEESFQFIEKMHQDLPKILNIVKLQEKQTVIQEKIIDLNHMADEAIVSALVQQYNIQI
jgi:hypothetical protein